MRPSVTLFGFAFALAMQVSCKTPSSNQAHVKANEDVSNVVTNSDGTVTGACSDETSDTMMQSDYASSPDKLCGGTLAGTTCTILGASGSTVEKAIEACKQANPYNSSNCVKAGNISCTQGAQICISMGLVASTVERAIANCRIANPYNVTDCQKAENVSCKQKTVICSAYGIAAGSLANAEASCVKTYPYGTYNCREKTNQNCKVTE